MQINHDMIVSMAFVYEQAKFWIPCFGFGFGIYKAIDKAFKWIKDIREKDLTDLKGKVEGINSGIQTTSASIQKMETVLSEKVDSQTISIVDQLKELRSDFRTFYTIPTPQMIPARAKPVKKAVNKTKQKAKAKPKKK